MTAWTDAVDATASGVGPAMWYRMGESSGTTLVHAGSPTIPDGGYLGGTKGETGAINEDDTAVAFTSSEYAFSGQTDFLDLVNECCVACWFKISAYDNIDLISYDGAGTDGVFLRMFTTGAIRFQVQRTTNGTAQSADAAIPLDGEWHFAVGRFSGSGDSNLVEIWLDGVKLAEDIASVPLTAPPMGTTDRVYFNKLESSTIYTGNVTLDEPIVWDRLISQQDIADLYAAANASNPVSLPMRLQGFVTATSASLPVRLRGITSVPAAGLPMTLQGPDPSHYQATAYQWTAKILLDDVDVSSQWTGAIRITAEENQSGLATVRLIPSAGALDLADYERKSLTIDFVAVDAAGATLYQVRRYTGRTTTATYNPDSGILAIQATTDLQRRFEGLSRTLITAIIGGQWSEYIFDDGADGWRYALDRLSTQTKCFFVDPWGAIKMIDWAAKTTPDVTFTDAGRFDDTLTLRRNRRRDLISQNKINLDFRFTRLRHRELTVKFLYTGGFCAYLEGKQTVPQKSTILSAASSTAWTRISDVAFTDLPGAGTYCGGLNWVGEPEAVFCIGAWWRAARRWAQTITEQYALTINAPDIAEAIGVQGVSENYGVEAIYDATDFERLTDYDSAPTGAVLLPDSLDYAKDADDVTDGGRTAMEAAQTCAIAKAKVEILQKARGNRVSVEVTYDPSISLASTVRINTPSLTAKGKVFAYTETLDSETGEPTLSLELAISRHGGSGAGVNDPITAPTKPDPPSESPHDTSLTLEVHAGGTTTSPAEDPHWDGWICNAYGATRDDPNNLYRERFVVRMPQIEAAARDAVAVQKPQTYEIAVPQDELTLSV